MKRSIGLPIPGMAAMNSSIGTFLNIVATNAGTARKPMSDAPAKRKITIVKITENKRLSAVLDHIGPNRTRCRQRCR